MSSVVQQYEKNSFIRNCSFCSMFIFFYASLKILLICMRGMNAFKCTTHIYIYVHAELLGLRWVLVISIFPQSLSYYFSLEINPVHLPRYNGRVWYIPIHILLEFGELFTLHLLGCLQEFNSPQDSPTDWLIGFASPMSLSCTDRYSLIMFSPAVSLYIIFWYWWILL